MGLGIGKKEKARKLEKLNRKARKKMMTTEKSVTKSVEHQGYFCTNLTEPVPNLNKAECEKVISHKNNQWIVLGRDRFASRASGYGGEGHTHSGMIDLVVGRMGMGADSDIFANPNFVSDAARIYISQKADIDKYFGLVAGRVGSSETRSAVGIKADAVRIIGREGIKLVTGERGDFNSQGGKISTIYGIDLIAGNDDNVDNWHTVPPERVARLQPIPKGIEVVNCVRNIVDPGDGLLGQLSGLLDTFVLTTMDVLSYAAGHTHIAPGFGAPTAPDPALIIKTYDVLFKDLTLVKSQLYTFKQNLTAFVTTHLMPTGERWICSRHNRTN